MDASTSPGRRSDAASLIAQRRIDASQASVRFEIGADWAQGRTTYGGMTAMLAVQAMRDIA